MNVFWSLDAALVNTTYCGFKIESPLPTLAQHKNSLGSISRVCCIGDSLGASGRALWIVLAYQLHECDHMVWVCEVLSSESVTQVWVCVLMSSSGPQRSWVDLIITPQRLPTISATLAGYTHTRRLSSSPIPPSNYA